jgi:hypothetical protein
MRGWRRDGSPFFSHPFEFFFRLLAVCLVDGCDGPWRYAAPRWSGMPAHSRTSRWQLSTNLPGPRPVCSQPRPRGLWRWWTAQANTAEGASMMGQADT